MNNDSVRNLLKCRDELKDAGFGQKMAAGEAVMHAAMDVLIEQNAEIQRLVGIVEGSAQHG